MCKMMVLVGLMAAVGCGGRQAPVGSFGEVTSAVVIVNPVINQGSTTTVTPGAARGDVGFQATGVGAVETDASGLAVVQPLPTGSVTLDFAPGAFSFNVAAERELYDVVLAVKDGTVQAVIPPVRYPIGGAVVDVAPGESIQEAAAADGTILFLAPGTYTGNLELRAEGVLIFGAWDPEDGPLSVIEGDVSVLGGGTRMRGVKVTGRLSSPANNFSAAFCDIGSASISGNGVSLLRNRFTQGQATVPSSNAVLVDNIGIP